MKRLSLRSRLIVAVLVVVGVQIVAALVVVSLTREQFLNQVDDRLEVEVASLSGSESDASTSTTDGPGADPDGRRPFGDLYQGRLLPDGTIQTVRAVNAATADVPQPEISAAVAGRSIERPVTTSLDDSGVEYRVRGLRDDTGDIVITAIPLDDVERRLERLTRAVVAASALVVLVLTAVTWWVLRLGVRPVKAMTESAEAIAAGDLSERVDEAHPATEAGQLGRALNIMLGRIQTSFDERTLAEDRLRRFMADASHEIRTPVATIRGYAELYEAGGLAEPADLDDAMRRTRLEAERMSRLVSDMLDLARLDRDPALRTSDVDVASIVRDVVADAAAAHPSRRVEIESVVAALSVEGDADLLHQAIGNVVTNAIEHTDPPSSIGVTAVRDHDDVIVRVADDGPGMSDEARQRATERFFRADPSRSRPNGGAGLGLAIVDSVVSAHHGHLRLDSILGSGTTVTLTLPRRPPDR